MSGLFEPLVCKNSAHFKRKPCLSLGLSVRLSRPDVPTLEEPPSYLVLFQEIDLLMTRETPVIYLPWIIVYRN